MYVVCMLIFNGIYIQVKYKYLFTLLFEPKTLDVVSSELYKIKTFNFYKEIN